MTNYSQIFSLLSDETRLRCLVLLALEEELCVCEITHTLETIQPKVSRHLSILRNSNLVLCERRGQWVYYKINKDYDKEKLQILYSSIDKLKHLMPFISDAKRLKTFRAQSTCDSQG